MLEWVQRYRSELLACLLVAEMLISPVADYHPHAGAALAAFIWLVVILAARYMAARRLVLMVVLPLAALWVIARLLEAFGDPSRSYSRLAPMAGFLLSLSLLWGIVERSHASARTMRTAIAESFIAYLLIAICFSQVYWMLNQAVPTPYNRVISPHEISTLLYFSMVTLSTVGYGYIVAINPYVRMVAAFESVVGVFYLAVVVSRLVALHSSGERKRGG